ncbi:MAG: diguanylate cyclase [Clostridium sp.]|nr:diguanylate cyclase [Clostridium sp.]MCM1547738.1 diguanylate cyclase [Ruminococcus sp.]
MIKKESITTKILIMVSSALVIISLIITAVGSAMIYSATEDGIRSDVKYAAHALDNAYELDYSGEYSMDRNILFKGDVILTESDFMEKTKLVSCEDDVDFTVFWGDTRIFTSVKNEDGSFAVGTTASKEIVKTVLGKGKEDYYGKADVNGSKYAGYYIPIINSDNEAVGMIFAGKPLESAKSNSNRSIGYFALISAAVLIASLFIFNKFIVDLVNALLDIRKYMGRISKCEFDEQLDEATLSRSDEVGDIARSAETMKDNLRDLIERDPLTSLLNRRSCQKLIDEIEEGRKYTVAMADIDFFKKINDKYGHACGDVILKGVSSVILEQTADEGAWISRWGGEEFLIVMPDLGIGEAKRCLDKLVDKMRETIFVWENNSLSVTMTIGAAEAIEGEKSDKAISRADDMLYEGKRSGKNKLVIAE